MRTYSAKPADITRKWYVLDAAEAPLGRVATRAAALLTGKAKPMFTKHIDTGDYVIVINAGALIATGAKQTAKKYYRHSGYPGGLKERSLAEQLSRDPSVVVRHAVRGMLPVNKLRDARIARLKIYPGPEHEHAPQQPEKLTLNATAKVQKGGE